MGVEEAPRAKRKEAVRSRVPEKDQKHAGVCARTAAGESSAAMCLPHDPAEAVGESLVPRGGVVDRDALEGFALSACRVEASAPTVVKFVRIEKRKSEIESGFPNTTRDRQRERGEGGVAGLKSARSTRLELASAFERRSSCGGLVVFVRRTHRKKRKTSSSWPRS